jgi:hypothetical protein
MPVHDWSKVDANLFHEFHQCWAMKLHDVLNELLPPGYSALVEQRTPTLEPDVLALERRKKRPRKPKPANGVVATLDRPATRFSEIRTGKSSTRGNRVVIRHKLGEIVCVIEVVSPGNKRSRKALDEIVEKSQDFLSSGINLLLIDILPPSRLAPTGLHPLIWEDEHDPSFDPTAEEPLTLAAYRAETPDPFVFGEAFLERVAIGGTLPKMPAFIEPDHYVNVPLEETYMQAWKSCPKDMRYFVEHGELPDDGDEE